MTPRATASGPLSLAVYSSPVGPVGLAADRTGLWSVELVLTSLDDFQTRLRPRFVPATIFQEAPLPAIAAELDAYFRGPGRAFRTPTHAFPGADFLGLVLRETARIPWGQTISYGELARRIHRPRAARAVGRALGANPLPLFIPCHRVVGANGCLTGFSGGGLAVKRWLLAHEGVLLPGS